MVKIILGYIVVQDQPKLHESLIKDNKKLNRKKKLKYVYGKLTFYNGVKTILMWMAVFLYVMPIACIIDICVCACVCMQPDEYKSLPYAKVTQNGS